MYRRGLEGLVVAKIISFTWLLNYKQTVSKLCFHGSTGGPLSGFREGSYGIFGNICIEKSPNKMTKNSGNS